MGKQKLLLGLASPNNSNRFNQVDYMKFLNVSLEKTIEISLTQTFIKNIKYKKRKNNTFDTNNIKT